MIEQIVQLIGAFLVLGGFAASQLGWLDVRDLRYLALNAIGSGILAVIAISDESGGLFSSNRPGPSSRSSVLSAIPFLDSNRIDAVSTDRTST